MRRIGKSINFGKLNIHRSKVGQKNVEEQLQKGMKNNKTFCLTVKSGKPARDPDGLIDDHNTTCALMEGKATAEKLFALLFTAEWFPCGDLLCGELTGGSCQEGDILEQISTMNCQEKFSLCEELGDEVAELHTVVYNHCLNWPQRGRMKSSKRVRLLKRGSRSVWETGNYQRAWFLYQAPWQKL